MAAGEDRRRQRPWWLLPLGIFASWRVVDGALLTWVGRGQLPESAQGQLGPGEPPVFRSPATYANLVANWDGQWYRRIVEDGYPSGLPRVDGEVIQNAWAYYPGYPTLVRGLTELGLGFGWAASLVSMLAAALAVCLLFRMLQRTSSDFVATAGVVGLCASPAAPVLQVAYTESLALLLVLVALWGLREQRYGAVLVAALALSLVRPIVLPLAAVVAVHGLVRWWKERAAFGVRERVVVGSLAVACGAMFLLWPAVVGWRTGEPRAYFLTQQAWIQEDVGVSWPSWVTVALGRADIALVLVLALVVVLTLVARSAARAWGTEGRAWVALYCLYVAASTQPTLSVLRYGLLAVFPWWPMPDVGREMRRSRQVLLLVAISVVGVGLHYLWLRWFWVPTTHSLAFP